MTPRLSSLLRVEDPNLVFWSETGQRNNTIGLAWASYIADRALLGWTFVWLGIRWVRRGLFIQRPEEFYEPLTWLGALAFPSPPSSPLWYVLFGLGVVCAILCLWRPQFFVARLGLAIAVLLLMAPEFSYGHVEHVNHLFLLAHTLALFLPIKRPTMGEEVVFQARAFQWYTAALLFPYTMAGLWKWVDMVVRPIFISSMTWLHPDALPVTSAHNYIQLDLPLTTPTALAEYGYFYSLGYIGLAFIFPVSSLAAFRRPFLFITLPTILLFHLSNVLTLQVLFISTCAVAHVLFLPYEWILPSIRCQLVPIIDAAFTGAGASARYERRYATGDSDTFLGFYAYRERLRDRSVVLAAPLYYPGMGWGVTQLLRLKQPADNASLS